MRAVDAAGHPSDPSNGADATVLDTEPPTSPENLTATAVSPSQIDLAWDAAADNVEVSGYEIYRDDALLTTIGPATSYSNGVIAPATHTYEVRALDAAGNRSDPSNSATASVTPPDLEDPGPPGNLQATVTASGDVDLSWDAATDNVGVTGVPDLPRRPAAGHRRRHDLAHRPGCAARRPPLRGACRRRRGPRVGPEQPR